MSKSASKQPVRHLPSNHQPLPPLVPTQRLTRPTPSDILRYRYQHGTNLGIVFILEQRLFGSMYDKGVKGSSELDAIMASLSARGLEATRQKWEAHWDTAPPDSDPEWLCSSAHCNPIRPPIGYFTPGPAFCGNIHSPTPLWRSMSTHGPPPKDWPLAALLTVLVPSLIFTAYLAVPIMKLILVLAAEKPSFGATRSSSTSPRGAWSSSPRRLLEIRRSHRHSGLQ